ncbi:MAG: DNA-processing protein DprA [Candidatus Cloacimonadaceae bacterium]
MPERLKRWLRLKAAPDIGIHGAFKLIQTFGDPYSWTKENLKTAFQQRFIIKTAYDFLISDNDPENFADICKHLENYNIRYTTYLDDDYPALLKTIFSPPLVLYYRGDLVKAQSDWNLAVVGTRKPSEYGKALTREITEPIAKAGVTIVSGLAYGIDTAAHKAALKAEGKTIAVLAQGLERIYPPQNRELAEQILHRGAIVSEFEPGSKMERWNFPARNRIISGLSQAVLVSEGPITSGALLTAKFALEQNRDVYALPGQVNIPNAQGPNHLIKNGARLVTTAEDILLDFGIDLTPPDQIDLFPVLSENEQTVYDLFKTEQREFSFDELVFKTGFTIGQISIVLLNLELKGLLLKTQGNMFALR